MLLRQGINRKFIVVIFITVLLFLYLKEAFSEPISIKKATRVHRPGGYLILINYETREKLMDNIVFRVHCEFDKGKFIFAGNTLNNIKRGWHKAKLPIADNMKKRYGPLRKYEVALYKDGLLIDTRRFH